ncbi:uncharacterized protein LOC123529252 isoform X4 [Mercenaria mercenaria]|uniref:uncharacterized protein LOC123529252 isoform X4 n=1 Tax=Mercenaria mercenaria TaxID=6596 RepID=UPI00234ED4D5|nr:uncharacterized protein LOC123529252 isoform X4 [Mercenaria mercenaria]
MSAETGDKQPETVKESPLSDSGRGSQSVVIINTENLNADVDQDVQIVENNNVDTDDDMNRYVYSDDFESDDEEDIEDSDELAGAYPSVVPGLRQRADNPVVPSTVTTLETPWGSKVYIVGTAHFSKESQDDVTKTIEATQPDVVMVELCNSRLNILQLDEEKLLEEAQNINLEKIQLAIKQSGLGQGIMHLLFLSMSAHLTKQLGMAPGGEFRRAFRDAKKIAGCRLQLGDRPIQVTLRRALSSLSVWQKIRLAWYLLTSNDPISSPTKCSCWCGWDGTCPWYNGELGEITVQYERYYDVSCYYLICLSSTICRSSRVPEEGYLPKVLRFGFRLSFLGIFTFACWRVYRWATPMIT